MLSLEGILYLHTWLSFYSDVLSFGVKFNNFFSSKNRLFYIDVQMNWCSFKWCYLIYYRTSSEFEMLSSSLFKFYFLLNPTYYRFVYFIDLFKEKAFAFDYVFCYCLQLSTSTLPLISHLYFVFVVVLLASWTEWSVAFTFSLCSYDGHPLLLPASDILSSCSRIKEHSYPSQPFR